MATTTKTRSQDESLKPCRDALAGLIQARINEDWDQDHRMQEIRRSAVCSAVAEGWPLSSVSEASGMPVEEIMEICE